MKIAFLNIYNGVIDRGSEVFVKEIARRFSEKHKVCVFQTGKQTSKYYEVKYISGIPFKRQGLLYDLLVFIFTLKCIPNLWKEKHDWIIPVNGRWQAVLCRIIRLIRGGKILITGHAGIGFDDKFNILIGKPDVFVALTQKAGQWARNLIKTVYYIPNGVDLTAFNPKIKPAEITLNSPVVFCNSSLLPYKRIDLAIKAVSLLPDVSLLVVGDGPLRKEFTALGKKLLGERFDIISSVKYEEIASYYRACNIFTLPSRESEAFGLVYLEALACNIPVVAPDDKNRREIIGGGGLFCDVENISEYAETIQKAIKSDFGDKPGKQAEKYSWDKIVQKYEEIIEQV